VRFFLLKRKSYPIGVKVIGLLPCYVNLGLLAVRLWASIDCVITITWPLGDKVGDNGSGRRGGSKPISHKEGEERRQERRTQEGLRRTRRKNQILQTRGRKIRSI
jgi:hypothetical protein